MQTYVDSYNLLYFGSEESYTYNIYYAMLYSVIIYIMYAFDFDFDKGKVYHNQTKNGTKTLSKSKK
jgi:hypothetical protein